MARNLAVGLVFGGFAVASLVGVVGYNLAPRTKPDPVSVAFSELVRMESPPAAVKVRGVAHYRGRATQSYAGGLFSDAKTVHVYGLFDTHDTTGREIQILVRSDVAPDHLVDFEYVELTGWYERPASHTVPTNTEILFSRANYFFSDNLWVLEPWQIESFDPAAEAPVETSD